MEMGKDGKKRARYCIIYERKVFLLERFCASSFPGPLATRKLVPFAYVALDPKWRPNFDPLGVEPRRWRF